MVNRFMTAQSTLEMRRWGVPAMATLAAMAALAALTADAAARDQLSHRVVAVLNNQPQGGFMMRRPTVDVPVASGNDWGNGGFGFFFQRNWNSQPANTRPRAGQYYQPMQQRWW